MKVKKRVISAVKYAIAAMVIAICLFPILWIFLSGFKTEREVLSLNFTFFPTKWVLDGYHTLLVEDKLFLRSTFVSLGVAATTTLGAMLLNSVCAYAFARLTFPGKKLLWAYVLIPMFVPSMAILVPSYIVVSKLGMVDTLAVLTVPFLFGVGGMFFIRQFYLNVPRSIEEAAIIDGAGRLRIYVAVFLPLSRGPLVLTGIQGFLGLYNSFLWPVLTIRSQELYQVMQTLAYYKTAFTSRVAVQVCGAALTALPTILLFICFQKYLIEGIKISGLK